MRRLDKENRLHFTNRGGIRLNRYVDETKGRLLQSTWTDIIALNSQAKERLGYPTQKPRALLERIIKASSNKGDIVLDPFCGCGTTCVAAENTERQWIGIDLSPVAGRLVRERLDGPEFGALFAHAQVQIRTDLPIRDDIGPLPHPRKRKHALFGRQEGRCNGCGEDFPFKLFEVDHIVPRAKGGTDEAGRQSAIALWALQSSQRRPLPS